MGVSKCEHLYRVGKNQKKVQVKETASLFGSKAKIDVFWNFFKQQI